MELECERHVGGHVAGGQFLHIAQVEVEPIAPGSPTLFHDASRGGISSRIGEAPTGLVYRVAMSQYPAKWWCAWRDVGVQAALATPVLTESSNSRVTCLGPPLC